MPNDTPTLLANASAGQLLDAAGLAERMAPIATTRQQFEAWTLLAELARAVAEWQGRRERWREAIEGMREAMEHASNTLRGGPTVGDAAKSPALRIHDAANTLDAALAATRHTQGEGT